MFSFIKVFLGIDENSKYVPINTNTSSGIYSPSSFGSSGNNSRSQSFVDGAGVWRDPGSGFVDNSGVWRDPGSGFVDGSGVWRESGSGFVDSSGVWRDPGSGFVDGLGVWRDGK
ncbi:MAG: hypothetical protein E7573_09925 [Ruminococcaceae bacterium]|nr:hypothetical protein [Oscillospiraceae bacterium]MBR3595566.1 hypothetical protein [Clostridia bacterium]